MVKIIYFINRFKGLESPVLILWGLDTLDLDRCDELLYVGISRAQSMLVFVGTSPTCNKIMAML